ncbi:MAG TPA: hypothetical protein VN612_15450 [Acidobacteriaceae bacterium]|nr:hypothetical protein [Acidobacteriaceae bacterium]
MSEHEDPQQIGRLAEDYARLKDEVYNVEQRVARAHRAYLVAALSFEQIIVQDNRLTVANSEELGGAHSSSLENLMSAHELIGLFHERSRLRHELDEVRCRLRGWLTHV